MRAAAVQLAATPFDVRRNLEAAGRLVRQAAAEGARLVVLPALFNTGLVYAARLRELAEDRHGPTVRFLRELSVDLGIYLAGSLLLRDGRHIYNTLALAHPKGRLDCYRQRHPFLWERCYFHPGSRPVIVETDLGRLGCLVGWDSLEARSWGAYAGRVEAVVVATAAPRLHRAVLNFPLGRKVYLAQLMPGLLRRREAIDRWFFEDLGAQAAALGVPVVHAALTGRFVTGLPFPRLSFLAAALRRPAYWRLAGQAHLATLRATFYGTTAIFDGDGSLRARVSAADGGNANGPGDSQAAAHSAGSGRALADVAPAASGASRLPAAATGVPAELQLLERVLKLLALACERKRRVPGPAK